MLDSAWPYVHMLCQHHPATSATLTYSFVPNNIIYITCMVDAGEINSDSPRLKKLKLIEANSQLRRDVPKSQSHLEMLDLHLLAVLSKFCSSELILRDSIWTNHQRALRYPQIMMAMFTLRSELRLYQFIALISTKFDRWFYMDYVLASCLCYKSII